jgi:uncharacterized protein YjbJ (UPF0337 family)
MQWEQVEGKWGEFKGKVQEKWGKLTNDDMMIMHGKKEQLIGKLKERYGYTVDQANKEVSAFMKDCNCSDSTDSKTKHHVNM